MHKGSKGKNITVSTNHAQVIQNGTLHITDAVRDYITQKPTSLFFILLETLNTVR